MVFIGNLKKKKSNWMFLDSDNVVTSERDMIIKLFLRLFCAMLLLHSKASWWIWFVYLQMTALLGVAA